MLVSDKKHAGIYEYNDVKFQYHMSVFKLIFLKITMRNIILFCIKKEKCIYHRWSIGFSFKIWNAIEN